ncbi:MAG: hypothetical protein Q8S84_03955 [bacterium]|nr:hypothetical protein [bacterium]
MKFSSSRSFSILTTTSFHETHICGAANHTHPFSGSFMYLIIFFHNFTASLKSLSVTLSAIFLSIGLSTHVSILNIFIKLIYNFIYYNQNILFYQSYYEKTIYFIYLT